MKTIMMKGSLASITVLIILCATMPAPGQNKGGIPGPDAPVSPSKAAAIRHLLDLTGSSKLSKQIMDELFSVLKGSSTQVPSSLWDELHAEYDTDLESGKLIDMIVPIYSRAFSEDEIKELVKFYESPIGKKVSSSLPQILRESMAVGQQWAGEVMKRIQTRLKEKGYSVSAE